MHDDDLLPMESGGRAVGRWADAVGHAVERLGIWIQEQAAELQWRRLRAIRRWGS